MGQTATKADFHWSYTEEPHATRLLWIVIALSTNIYLDVAKFSKSIQKSNSISVPNECIADHINVVCVYLGIDISFKYVVLLQVLTQIVFAYLLKGK